MTSPTTELVHLTRRELRLMLLRILAAYDTPRGLIPAVAESLVTAAALGAPVVRSIVTDQTALATVRDYRIPGWAITDGVVVIDGGGQWAPVLAPAIADIVLIANARESVDAVRLVDVAEPGLAEGLRSRLAPHGIVLAKAPDAEATWALSRGADAALEEALDRLLHQGVPSARDEWLALYRLSLEGLAPESEESFLHAGYVDDSGALILGMDDDHDIEAALQSLS